MRVVIIHAEKTQLANCVEQMSNKDILEEDYLPDKLKQFSETH